MCVTYLRRSNSCVDAVSARGSPKAERRKGPGIVRSDRRGMVSALSGKNIFSLGYVKVHVKPIV
jgi:hypothetical protein